VTRPDTPTDVDDQPTGNRTPAQVLQEAHHRDSRAKRARVLQAVEELVRTGRPITFAAVARTARVSTWLVYADGVRHHIEAAMRGQTVQPTTDEQVSRPASPASLRTDLELAREEIRSLRAERDKLRQAARLSASNSTSSAARTSSPASTS
jgi:hypothetical protein